MTKFEILQIAKPILFNTEMVHAILDGRKTQTRRIIKQNTSTILSSPCRLNHPELSDNHMIEKLCLPRYGCGNYLYVRETWFYEYHMHDLTAGEPDLPNGKYSHRYIYRATNPGYPVYVGVCAGGWRPSIHMPKEAARIFLRVKAVRAERLQDIDVASCVKEGVLWDGYPNAWTVEAKPAFIELWNSTVKKSNIEKYGWNANPWVWVYEFERVEL